LGKSWRDGGGQEEPRVSSVPANWLLCDTYQPEAYMFRLNRSFLLAFFLLLPCAFAQSNSDITPAVEQVLAQQVDAWNHHDLEAFMRGYWNSPELTFFSDAQKTSGWQPTLERYRKRYQSEGHEMGKLDFSDLNVQSLGSDAAFVRGAWHLTMLDGKTPHGLFTLIFRKFPDGWKIVHDHTSLAAD
jgi:ketosteroid isomerase-like protein